MINIHLTQSSSEEGMVKTVDQMFDPSHSSDYNVGVTIPLYLLLGVCTCRTAAIESVKLKYALNTALFQISWTI